MNGVISLTLDVPPSANIYWRVWRNRAVRSAAAEAYCNKVLLHARNRNIKPLPLKTPVSVTLRWFRAIKAGDLDNRLKVALDALQGAVLVNDSQVVELHAYRYEDKEHPRVEVEIERLDEPKVA